VTPLRRGLSFSTRFAAALVDLVFPPCCAGCGAELATGVLCERCAPLVERIASPRCPRCGVPFEGAGADHLCARCILDAPRFASAAAAFEYAGPLADGLRALKYGPRAERIEPLSRLWREACPALPPVELAVPVPLHRAKLRARGFNQTVQVALPLLRDRGLRLDCRVLVRLRAGDSQASLTLAERRRAPRGAFAATRRAARLAGRRVLLLDDVMTTGATADECARVLLAAGAAEVHVAVLARTVKLSA
jgi:ComF family protein